MASPQTLDNSESTDLSTETQIQQIKDDPVVLEEDNQDPYPQFRNPTTRNRPDMQDEDGLKAVGEDDEDPDHAALTSPRRAMLRKPIKRKKGPFSWKKQQAIEKKVQTLLRTLKPIPFAPKKRLDFDRHEELLKRLELWDFVHFEFDTSIRSDLLAQLIVNFDSKMRTSSVNGYRIDVNRPFLGRALKLPVKRKKAGSGAQGTVVLDVEEYGEVSVFLEEFLANWVLLHGPDWVIPHEVMEIKSSMPEKVDWAGIFFFMVEKELSQGVKLEDCYYASHLQSLIKYQREELFFEEETEVEVREEEGASTVNSVKVDSKSVSTGELYVVLTLGQEDVEKEEAKDEEVVDVEKEEMKDEEVVDVEKEEMKDEEVVDVEKEEMKEEETVDVEKEEMKEEEIVDVEKSSEVVDECKDAMLQDHWILQRCNMKEDKTVGSSEENKLGKESEKFIAGEEDETKFEQVDERSQGTLAGAEEDGRKIVQVDEGTIVGAKEDETKIEQMDEGTFIRAEVDEMKLEEEGDGKFVAEKADEMKLEEEGERKFVTEKADEMKLEEEGVEKLITEEEDEMELEEDGEGEFVVAKGDEVKLEEEGKGKSVVEKEDEVKLEEEGEGMKLEEELEGEDGEEEGEGEDGEEEGEGKDEDGDEEGEGEDGDEEGEGEDGEEEDEMKLQEEGEGPFVIEEEDEVEDVEEEFEDDEEEDNDDGVQYSIMPNQGFRNDGFAANLQEMDMNNTSYGVTEQFDVQSDMVISPTAKPYPNSGGPSYFGMKREISYDHNLMDDPLNRGNKRPRTDGSSSKSSEFGFCMDQIQLWVGKARDMIEVKEKEVEASFATQQMLISELQEKNNLINHLEMTKYEELKKKDEEIYRLDRELFVMGNLINGYRGAIKATRRDFADYRARCELPEEPIYKDVGPGGLMLSTMEIERRRLKKEEEDRVNKLIVEQNLKKFEEGCAAVLEGQLNRVHSMDMKLLDLEKKVSQIKVAGGDTASQPEVSAATIES